MRIEEPQKDGAHISLNCTSSTDTHATPLQWLPEEPRADESRSCLGRLSRSVHFIQAAEGYLSYSIKVIKPPISFIGSPGFITWVRMWQWNG